VSKANYKRATEQEVLEWIQSKKILVNEYSNGRVDILKESLLNGQLSYKVLSQRINRRRGSRRGDARVDIRFKNLRRSMTVSRLVWMSNTGVLIPPGFEIHHRNEDCSDNRWKNLLCVFSLDHMKLHEFDDEDDIPF
jgi:hypothetical protein